MNTAFFNHITSVLNQPIINYAPVSGGDISEAFKINTAAKSYFLKTNSSGGALNMFQTEKLGLEIIKNTNTIAVPELVTCGNLGETAFLLMEFIETKTPSETDFKTLAEHLAKLHKTSADNFGLSTNNFIGSLPQQNKFHKHWTDFYINQRLLPQLNLAKTNNLLQDSEIPTEVRLKEVLTPLFKNIKPSLIHGDFWSGNYIIAKNGTPYLIDPAIYFGHNEVDIAMSKLFGGFSNAFYDVYQNIFSFDDFTETRIEIYQLYYLLVHLNLFGKSYYTQVKHVLNNNF
ncbi:fructosamine kinase family protein [Tamlana sp. 62-3]|uniref:Fructosamine kinase family protein n=1 Tax=Neotamlana sargassicola TaxID=2883125 RepID=A0A9X1L553_9FLAO|nr:fructosamine kinase family protein [Tamlana sargassicola]MCB4808820.1 fructosamine kinase family protein [Tamlana sargassicola]